MELKKISKAFDILAKAYDLISYTMSLGITIYWRKKLIDESINKITPNTKYIIDLCSGTGDIAIGIIKKSQNTNINIIAFDASFGMLKILKQKSKNINNIFPILGDISQMPFKNKSFQISTMSFGARSLFEGEKDFKEYLKEIYRTSSNLINLETSHPKNPIIRILYYSYLYLIIIILGSIFFPHYNKEYYKTIMNFPNQEKLTNILKEIGYKHVVAKSLLWGTAAIHIAHE
ncbi:MAG: class I SAM-dependent methyltransferase [Candidatus Calescibacterium sp.]|nr:class I SAM-dependent methyltransferase [Candidatus Calescibacterium sp.]MCX7972690.1 class I SAM-dependent methyltransferase [bacterium]MDW8194713.1 class I SAM-dependent methyltransferase [Candidatus Calescibacterium sp.]